MKINLWFDVWPGILPDNIFTFPTLDKMKYSLQSDCTRYHVSFDIPDPPKASWQENIVDIPIEKVTVSVIDDKT